MRVICKGCKQTLFVNYDLMPDKLKMTCTCGQKVVIKMYQKYPNKARMEREAEAVRMREAGMTWQAIGEHFGKCDTWAIQVVKRIRPELINQAVYKGER